MPRVQCGCGRGSYDDASYSQCFLCSTEGKEDCPGCGKKRSVDPERFRVCFNCNQSGGIPKCQVCRNECLDYDTWERLPDGRNFMVCWNCMSKAEGDVTKLPVPQPTMPGMGAGTTNDAPAAARPPPSVKIGGRQVGVEGIPKRPPPNVDLGNMPVKATEGETPVTTASGAAVTVDADMPWYSPITEHERTNERVNCAVCNQLFFQRKGFRGPNVCVGCKWAFESKLTCECCREKYNTLIPQARFEPDGKTERLIAVCAGCLFGYHGMGCNAPSEFPLRLCPNDGGVIFNGSALCHDCASQRIAEMQI